MSIRPVKRIIQSKPTIEGAGVKLQRAFGFGKTTEFDPFLLLDDFRNENPADYLAGFPWHPHRGIETITTSWPARCAHGDSLGNKGRMTAGDVQWMTAGSGILHQEMPKGDERGRMHGFQLWANLPASLKMTDPRYQDIPSSESPRSPKTTVPSARHLRRVLGQDGSRRRRGRRPALRRHLGSARQAKDASRWRPRAMPSPTSSPGAGTFRDASDPQAVLTESAVDPNAAARRRRITPWCCSTAAMKSWCRPVQGIRFLLVSGKPLEEPVAWYGPIVMNTQAQLRQAMAELHTGTFIKHG